MTRGLLLVAVGVALLLWGVAARGLVWAVEPTPLRLASLPTLATEPLAFARATNALDTIFLVDVVTERQLVGGLASGALDAAVVSPEQALVIGMAELPVRVVAFLPGHFGEADSALVVVARTARIDAEPTLASAWRTAGELAARDADAFMAHAGQRLHRTVDASDVADVCSALVTDHVAIRSALTAQAAVLANRGVVTIGDDVIDRLMGTP